MARPRMGMETRHKVTGFLFVTPWIIGFLLFFLYPLINSIIISMSEITEHVGFKTQWTGFGNYARAFVYDIYFVPMFMTTVANTLTNMPLIIAFSLFIAILINQKIRLRGFFRGAFFLPVLLGAGFIMRELLGQNIDESAVEMARGILMPDQMLRYLGPGVMRVVNNFLARITIILWKSGVQIVLCLAGLQSIPGSLYEAADCDGATPWEKFWKVTLPMMSPVILLCAVYTLIDSFADAENPIVRYILEVGFNRINFEYAAAMGWIFFLFIIFVILVVFGIMRIIGYDTAER